jgi:hypothetical protein
LADPDLDLDDEFQRDLEFFNNLSVGESRRDTPEVEVERPAAPALPKAPVEQAAPVDIDDDFEISPETSLRLKEMAHAAETGAPIAAGGPPAIDPDFRRYGTEGVPDKPARIPVDMLERLPVTGPPRSEAEAVAVEETEAKAEDSVSKAYSEFENSFDFAESQPDVAKNLAKLYVTGVITADDMEFLSETSDRGQEHIAAIQREVPALLRDGVDPPWWHSLLKAAENISDALGGAMEDIVEDPLGTFGLTMIPRASRAEWFDMPISEMEMEVLPPIRDKNGRLRENVRWRRKVLTKDDYEWWHKAPPPIEHLYMFGKRLFGERETAMDYSLRSMGLNEMADGAVMSSVAALLADGPSDIIRDSQPGREAQWARAVFSSGVALTKDELQTVFDHAQIHSVQREWEGHNETLVGLLRQDGPLKWLNSPITLAVGGGKLISGLQAGAFHGGPRSWEKGERHPEYASLEAGSPITTVERGMGWIPLPPQVSRRKDLLHPKKKREVAEKMRPIIKSVEDHVLHNRGFQKQRDIAVREYAAFWNPAGWVPFAKMSTPAQVAGRQVFKFANRELAKRGISKTKANFIAQGLREHTETMVHVVGPSEAYEMSSKMIQRVYRKEAPKRVDDLSRVFDDKVGIAYGRSYAEILPGVDLLPATVVQRIRPIKGMYKAFNKIGMTKAARLIGAKSGKLEKVRGHWTARPGDLWAEWTELGAKVEADAYQFAVDTYGSTNRAIVSSKIQKRIQAQWDFWANPAFFVDAIWRKIGGVIWDASQLDRLPISRQFRTMQLSMQRQQTTAQRRGVAAYKSMIAKVEDTYRPRGEEARALKADIALLNKKARLAKAAGEPAEQVARIHAKIASSKRKLKGTLTTEQHQETLLSMEHPRLFAKQVAPAFREVAVTRVILDLVDESMLPHIDDLIANRLSWHVSTDNMAAKYVRGDKVWNNFERDILMLDPYGDGNTLFLRIRKAALAEQRATRKAGKDLLRARERMIRGAMKEREFGRKMAKRLKKFESSLGKIRTKLQVWNNGSDAASWIVNGLKDALSDLDLKTWKTGQLGKSFPVRPPTVKGKTFTVNFQDAMKLVHKALGKDAPELRRLRSIMAKLSRRKSLKREEMEFIVEQMETSHKLINSAQDEFLEWKPGEYVKPGVGDRPPRPKPAKGVAPLDDQALPQYRQWHTKTDRLPEQTAQPTPGQAAAAAPDAPPAGPLPHVKRVAPPDKYSQKARLDVDNHYAGTSDRITFANMADRAQSLRQNVGDEAADAYALEVKLRKQEYVDDYIRRQEGQPEAPPAAAAPARSPTRSAGPGTPAAAAPEAPPAPEYAGLPPHVRPDPTLTQSKIDAIKAAHPGSKRPEGPEGKYVVDRSDAANPVYYGPLSDDEAKIARVLIEGDDFSAWGYESKSELQESQHSFYRRGGQFEAFDANEISWLNRDPGEMGYDTTTFKSYEDIPVHESHLSSMSRHRDKAGVPPDTNPMQSIEANLHWLMSQNDPHPLYGSFAQDKEAPLANLKYWTPDVAAREAAAAAPELKVEMFEAGNWRTADGKFEIMKASERYGTNEKGWALGQWEEGGGTIDWGAFRTKRDAVEYLRTEVYDPKGSSFESVWGAKKAAPEAPPAAAAPESAPPPAYQSREQMQLGARTGMPLTPEDVAKFPPDPTAIPARAASKAVGAEPAPRMYANLPDMVDDAVRQGRFDDVPDSVLWHYGREIDKWYKARLAHLEDEVAQRGGKLSDYEPFRDEIWRKQEWLKRSKELKKRAASTDTESLVRLPAPGDTGLERFAGHPFLAHVQRSNKARIELGKAMSRVSEQAEKNIAMMEKYGEVDFDKAWRMASDERAKEVEAIIASSHMTENAKEAADFFNAVANRHPDPRIQSLADAKMIPDEVMAGRPRYRPTSNPDPQVQSILDDAVKGMDYDAPEGQLGNIRNPVVNSRNIVDLVSQSFDPKVRVVDKAVEDLSIWLKDEFADGLRLLHEGGYTMDEISAWIPHIIQRKDLIMAVRPIGGSMPQGVNASKHRYWETVENLRELGLQPVDDARYAYTIWRATVESMLAWSDFESKIIKKFGRQSKVPIKEGEGALGRVAADTELHQAVSGIRGVEREYVLKGETYLIPKEVAEGLDRMVSAFQGSNADLASLIPGLRWATQTFKGLATGIFPRFHERNIISSAINAWTYNVNDPRVYMEAFKTINTPGQTKGIAGDVIPPPPDTLAASQKGLQWADEVIGDSGITRRQIREELNNAGILRRNEHAVNTQLGTMDELKREFGATSKIGKTFHTLQQANLLSRQFAPVKVGREVGSVIEDWLRTAAYIDGRVNKGMGIQESIERVIKIHFDYDDLTPSLRFMRDYVTPFSTWKRKNIGLQIDAMINRPNKFYRMHQLQTYVEALGSGDEVDEVWMPEWWSNMWGLTVGKEDRGKKSLAMFRFGLPGEDLNALRMFIPAEAGGRSTTRVLSDELLGSLYPWYKWPFEEKLDNSGHAYSFFKGRPLYDRRTEAPAWIMLIDQHLAWSGKDKNGKDQGFRAMMGLRREEISIGNPDDEKTQWVWRMNESTLRSLSTLPPAYYLNTIPGGVGLGNFFLGNLMDLTPKQRAQRSRVMGAVTPFKAYEYDPMYQKSVFLRDWARVQRKIRLGLDDAVPNSVPAETNLEEQEE